MSSRPITVVFILTPFTRKDYALSVSADLVGQVGNYMSVFGSDVNQEDILTLIFS
jgi:hypothetical protein